MIWTAPTVDRADVALVLGEREALEAWLDYHRETLLMKCAGMSAEQLRCRAAAPSSLCLLGLVRHMTEVERWWFRMHAAGQELDFPYGPMTDRSRAFDDVDGADPQAELDAYRGEIEQAKAAVRDLGLDDRVDGYSRYGVPSRNLRWIYVHMIEEYARHNGHADLLREHLDGVVGD